MRRRVRIFSFILLFFAESLLCVFGETFWNGLINYTPPIPMFGGDEPGNEGVPIVGLELRHEGAADGYAQVNFQIYPLTILFDREEPKEPIKTIAALKNFADSQLKNTTNASTTIVDFEGKQALATIRTNQNPGMSKFYYSIAFFWKQNRVWPRSSLFNIQVTAEKPENFQKLIASVKTVKIDTNLLIPKFAKDEMQLGMSQDETRAKCGEPFERIGPNEAYITALYLISVQFDSSKISELSYTKLSDTKKFGADPSVEAVKEQLLPISEAEAQSILARNTNRGKVKWALIASGRWKRSDGAMAALTKQGLTIASAEIWPKLRLRE